jgi:hypothetical protein
MKNSLKNRLIFTCALLIVISITTTGYSQKKTKKSLPKGTIKLEYKYPSDKVVKYFDDSKVNEVMDVNGQSMQVNVSSVFGCSIKTTGKQDGNIKLEIRMDTMAQNIDTPQGTSGGTIKEIQGKTFNMILSPTGKEVDVSEAEKIIFNVEGSGQSNASQSFLSFFPDLPKDPVKPGDTWISIDSVTSKTPIASMKMQVKSENKYEGIEKIDGTECAKISSAISGTREMTAQTQGMDVYTSGPFTGNTVLFFAVKEGYFIRQIVTTKMTGTIEISGPQNMSFPVVMDMTSTNEVRK